MKKLDHYFPTKSGRRTPAKVSESPILSPDTAKALENAERLVKETQKKILEASYDIDSSPEREKSTGFAGEAEDEDALYIRDIVSTRFHEANESARIFTRPSTRPLSERLCRPEVRRRFPARRLGEGTTKIRGQRSPIRKSKNSRPTCRTIDENFNVRRLDNSLHPRRASRDEEIRSRLEKASMTSGCGRAGKVAERGSINWLGVQEGPRLDIRNELTVTEVENVDISPKPRSSLPVRNIKTYEFRHESCAKDVVAESDEARSTGVSGPARRTPEVAEESADPLRSEAGPAPARQGSRSDLDANKSGRSIRPRLLEGRADDARISKRDAMEREENRPESFVDFLRRVASDEAPNHCEEAKDIEASRNRVPRSTSTNEKIGIVDRAIDEFLEEFVSGDRPKKISSGSRRRRNEENRSAESDVVDGDRFDDGAFHDFARRALEDEPEVFGDDWNPEDIKLETPNFGDLEKTVRRFDSNIEKILRGTRNLDILISRYCVETEAAERPEVADTEREAPSSPFSTSKEIPEIEQKKTAHFFRKKDPTYEDNEHPIGEDEDSRCSSEESRESRSGKSGREASREAMLGWRDQKFPRELAETRPRFSTPLNDGSTIVASSRRANGARADFEEFLIGIERPKCSLERRRVAVSVEPEVSSGGKVSEEENFSGRKKIVLDRTDRSCNFDELDRDRPSALENEANSREKFAIHTAREKRFSFERRNSGGSLIQDSAIGRTTDQSEKISLGTKLIDERVARKDSSRSERSAPARKNHEKSVSLSAKTLTVKNRFVDVATMAGKFGESRKLSDDGTRKQRSRNEETEKKNRLAGSASSSPRDRTSFDVSTVYSDDFEEPMMSGEKSQEKIVSTMGVEEKSVSEEKKSSELMDDGKRDVERDKSVLKEIDENLESTRSDGQNSIFKEKRSSAMMNDGNRRMEEGENVFKRTEEELKRKENDGQNSTCNETKSSSVMNDRDEEVEDVAKTGQNSIIKEKKPSVIINDGSKEVEEIAKTGQNSIIKEKKPSVIINDRSKEVEDAKSVLNRSEENVGSTKNDGKNSILNEKKSSGMIKISYGEVEEPVMTEENSISKDKKTSTIMDVEDREVENGKIVSKKTGEEFQSMKSDGQISIVEEKKSSVTTEVEDGKTARGPRESSEWPKRDVESREETKYPEKAFSVSVNESSDGNKDDDECRGSEKEVSVKNNSRKKEAVPDWEEVSEKSSEYRASVLSSSGSIKASGISSLLKESHREAIKGPEESNVVETPGDSVLEKKPIASFRFLCDGVMGRCSCEEYTNRPVLERLIEDLEESNSNDGVENAVDDSVRKNKEEDDEEERSTTEPELEVLGRNRLDEAFTEFHGVFSSVTKEDSTDRFVEPLPSGLKLLGQEDDVQKENTQYQKKEESINGPENLYQPNTPRTDRMILFENEADESRQIFCDFEKMCGFESSTIIHSTPKDFIVNSGRTMESLVLPLPDPIPDDDHIERTADACSENYSEGELYLPSSCSYSLGEIRISERPSYGTVGTGIESSTRNSDGIRIFFTKSYATVASSDRTINAQNMAMQSPGEVQETDVESICSS